MKTKLKIILTTSKEIMISCNKDYEKKEEYYSGHLSIDNISYCSKDKESTIKELLSRLEYNIIENVVLCYIEDDKEFGRCSRYVKDDNYNNVEVKEIEIDVKDIIKTKLDDFIEDAKQEEYSCLQEVKDINKLKQDILKFYEIKD